LRAEDQQTALIEGYFELPFKLHDPPAGFARLRGRPRHPADAGISRSDVGMRRTTVTIAARLLQSAGLIRYRRGHIQILDRKALEDIACECYAVVRQNADKVFSTLRSSRYMA
jgi:hypothetical protein